MRVGDEDVKSLIVGEFPVSSPPLDLRQWVGVHVTRDVVRLTGPDVHASRVIMTKTRLV